MTKTNKPITWVDPETIRELPNNPNNMSPSEYKSLVDSMETRGRCVQSVLVAKETEQRETKYVLIDGAHRLRACRELGYKVPVIVEAMKPDEIWAWRIGMNKRRGTLNLTMAGEQMLDLLSDACDLTPVDVSVMCGFDKSELDVIVESLTRTEGDVLEGLDNDDEFASGEPAKPKTYNLTIGFPSDTDRMRVKARLLELAGDLPMGEGLALWADKGGD